MNAPTPTPVNFSLDMANQANKRWNEYFDWAAQVGLPLSFTEAQLRDKLSLIDGLRMAQALKQHLPGLSR